MRTRTKEIDNSHGDDNVRQDDHEPGRHGVSSFPRTFIDFSRCSIQSVRATSQTSCQGADASQPATQVMNNARVIDENTRLVMTGENAGDERILSSIRHVPTDRHL